MRCYARLPHSFLRPTLGWCAAPECLTQDGGAGMHAQDKGTWVWHYEENEMPYELHSLFRLRVKDVKFHKPPNAQELSESRDTEGALGSKENPFVPMQVPSS